MERVNLDPFLTQYVTISTKGIKTKVKAKNMESQSWCERLYEGNTKPGRRERCHGNRGESKGWWLSTSDAEDKSRKELRGCAHGKMEAFLEEA